MIFVWPLMFSFLLVSEYKCNGVEWNVCERNKEEERERHIDILTNKQTDIVEECEGRKKWNEMYMYKNGYVHL